MAEGYHKKGPLLTQVKANFHSLPQEWKAFGMRCLCGNFSLLTPHLCDKSLRPSRIIGHFLA